MAEEKLAFPYTDDFRRAKRNSLLWSGVTLVAAMGSPPVVGGESTFGQLGFSLTYDKSAIVGVAGIVSAFMAVGFYQAFQRMKLHASQLFAGETDVDRVFGELKERAFRGRTKIAGMVEELPKIADKLIDSKAISEAVETVKFRADTSPDLRELRTDLHNASVNPDYQAKFSNFTPDLNDKILAALNAEQENSKRRVQAADELKGIVSQVRNDIHSRILEILSEEDERIQTEESDLLIEIKRLLNFHQGLYRSELRWFWAFDVAPVAVLFLGSMVPFVRLFL